MDEARGSDISKTQMDLVNLSEIEPSHYVEVDDDDSLHPVANETKGFCVKEFEEKLQSLQKENFNLKLRIYFLEDKNPNIPEGAETLYKQNIDLKIENETLLKELQEKQDLLCQASKALELLDEQKNNDLRHSQMMIEELTQRAESLQFEVVSLQNALSDANKSQLANDTGYAGFLEAVDSKDVELHRKMQELAGIESNFKDQMNEINQQLKDLQTQKTEIELKSSNLLYENDELKDKLAEVEQKMIEQTASLEKELREYKDKWASAQCDLQDTIEKLKETEMERVKSFSCLKSTLEALEQERQTTNNLNKEIAGLKIKEPNSKSNSRRNSDKSADQSSKEISRLQKELERARFDVEMSMEESATKSREIEKLANLLDNIERSSIDSKTSRVSLEMLSDAFNDLKLQQALEQRKQSLNKISEVMNDLAGSSDARIKEHVAKLQIQLAIVTEKQEVADSALEKCANLCCDSLNYLNELASFLNNLLQQKQFRESMSEMTMFNIQSAIDKTMEFSQHAERFSIDGRMSSLPNISSLEILMTTARVSLANVKEIQRSNKSIQASNDDQIEILEVEMNGLKKELEDMNRVNQVLEDEICLLKEAMKDYKEKMAERDLTVADLKAVKGAMNVKIQESEKMVEALSTKRDELEQKLQAETVKKFEFESKLLNSETLAIELQQKLSTLHGDLEANWITKEQHDIAVNKLEEDIVNGEAQVAAIRMEMNVLQENLVQAKTENEMWFKSDAASMAIEDDKENLVLNPSRRTLEISDERKLLLMSNHDSAVSSTTDTCDMCPKYQAKVSELKKYLNRAMDKIKAQSALKVQSDRQIQKQLSQTETFLDLARSKMETILKSRDSNEQ